MCTVGIHCGIMGLYHPCMFNARFIPALAFVAALSLGSVAQGQPLSTDFAWASWTNDRLCVAAPMTLMKGAPIHVHFQDLGRSVGATITRRASGSECETFSKNLAVGETHFLHMFVAKMLSTPPEMPAEGIAQLTSTQVAPQFKVCTTSEGAIGTVWEGAVLRSKLLWVGYSYAGMDLEATCTPREVRAMVKRR